MPYAGCPCRCSFCNQHHITGQSETITPEDVHRAVSRARERIRKEPQSIEIAFFGGSFTAIPRAEMLALLRAAREEADRHRLGGIRISTRPDAIDADILSILKGYGVTSVELGAQSMSDHVLTANRRGHTAADVETAAGLIHQFGMELGLQMMTGLYQDDPQTALETAEKIIALSPATVRIYPTLVFEGTELHELWKQGSYTPQSLEQAVSLCTELLERFEKANVRVIRLGLHADGNGQSPVAGPFHPAFKELCLSRRFYRDILLALQEQFAATGAVSYHIKLHPKSLSAAIGQKRSNCLALERQGFSVDFQVQEDIPIGQFRIEKSEEQSLDPKHSESVKWDEP